MPTQDLDRSQFWPNCGDTKSTAQHVAFTARNRADAIAFSMPLPWLQGRWAVASPGCSCNITLVLDPDGNTLKIASHGLK